MQLNFNALAHTTRTKYDLILSDIATQIDICKLHTRERTRTLTVAWC